MLAPELPPPVISRERPSGVVGLRVFGIALMLAYVVGSAFAEPSAGLSGDGLGVTACCAALLLAVAVIAQTRTFPPGVRLAGLLVTALASIGLVLLQGEQSAAISGFYFTVIIAALRLPVRQAVLVSAVAVLGGALAYGLAAAHAEGQIISLVAGVPPWFVVMRVLRELRQRQADALDTVEELRASREAQAAAAAAAERERVARELHDVLAHSLAGLTIQLEAARVLASRGEDLRLTEHLEHAHGLAATGLDEARRAIGALRGEELPGPDRLPELVEAFTREGGAAAHLAVTGEPRPLGAEAGLALFRVAQEALTNVRRHAAGAEAVELRLDYGPDVTMLVVADHGAPVPVAAGAVASSPGGGYGLTGMRERAELLGGRLTAGPGDDGFRVELCLPR